MGGSFADLNIITQDANTNGEILQFIADYGYECVALNHEITLAKKVQIREAPDLQSLVKTRPVPKGCRQAMQVLQRLTVTVEDPSVLHILSSPQLDSYDVLAICPGTDKVLQQACSVLNVDIISLKLDERLPFRLKHAQIGQAVERGIYFEICYSPALKDATARRNVLANAMELVDVSRKKNIIVSSQAMKGLDARGPSDVINLCQLFGLTGEACRSSITSHCRAVLLHSAMRRKTIKGVVACELISKEPPQDDTNGSNTVTSTPEAAETSMATPSGAYMAGTPAEKKSRKRRKKSRGGDESSKRAKL